MSLRLRLTLVTLLVALSGLLAANVVTYRFLRGFLVARVDEQLSDGRGLALSVLTSQGGNGGQLPGDLGPVLPPGTYAALILADGTVIQALRFDYVQSVPSPPALVPHATSLQAAQTAGTDGLAFEAQAGDGSRDYRVLATGLNQGNGLLVVAIPMDEVDDTLQQLVLIEVVTTAVVGVVLVVVAFLLVRAGLRPLARMAATASAVADGDMSLRVEPGSGHTEVGRLGAAINTMLARLEEAFAQQRASEDRLRRFIADASHELRTPLTSIRGYAELFRWGADERPEDLALTMRRIEEEGARMGVLVEDLLLLARLDQPRQLELDDIDMAEIARAAVDAARAVAPDRPISYGGPSIAPMRGDAVRLRQVVDNLLRNAREHTPAGTAVHVSLVVEGQELVLMVEDEGEGVPDEAMAHLFEPFFRADPGRARERGGAGLGLAIVARIVSAHGGRATCERREPHGARFRIALPLAGPRDESGSPMAMDHSRVAAEPDQ